MLEASPQTAASKAMRFCSEASTRPAQKAAWCQRNWETDATSGRELDVGEAEIHRALRMCCSPRGRHPPHAARLCLGDTANIVAGGFWMVAPG